MEKWISLLSVTSKVVFFNSFFHSHDRNLVQSCSLANPFWWEACSAVSLNSCGTSRLPRKAKWRLSLKQPLTAWVWTPLDFPLGLSPPIAFRLRCYSGPVSCPEFYTLLSSLPHFPRRLLSLTLHPVLRGVDLSPSYTARAEVTWMGWHLAGLEKWQLLAWKRAGRHEELHALIWENNRCHSVTPCGRPTGDM